MEIARNVAPDEGAKACALRPVSRRLDVVVAPVTWSSLAAPFSFLGQDGLLATILLDVAGRNTHITSIQLPLTAKISLSTTWAATAIRTLPNLRRLSLFGEVNVPFPPSMLQVLTYIPTLHTIQLLRLDLTRLGDGTQWAPSLLHIHVDECTGAMF